MLSTSKHRLLCAFAVLVLNVANQAVGQGGTVTRDIRGPHVFHFRIDPNLPPFRIEYVGDDANAPVEIRCYRAGDAKPFQQIDISEGEAPYRGCNHYLTAIDMNGDGYKDLRVLSFWGATGNEIFTVYLWNTHTARFELSDAFSACGKSLDKDGCCETHRNAGHAGREFLDSKYCMREGALVLVKRVRQEMSKAEHCFYRTVEELIRGELQVVSRTKVGCDEPK